MLNLVADVVFSLAIAHAATVTVQELFICFPLLLVFFFLVVLSTESLVDQIQEDSLSQVAELAQIHQVMSLAFQDNLKRVSHALKD